jgi:hypothetical protein
MRPHELSKPLGLLGTLPSVLGGGKGPDSNALLHTLSRQPTWGNPSRATSVRVRTWVT